MEIEKSQSLDQLLSTILKIVDKDIGEYLSLALMAEQLEEDQRSTAYAGVALLLTRISDKYAESKKFSGLAKSLARQYLEMTKLLEYGD